MSLSREQARFTKYADTYLKGEEAFEGYATALPGLASTPTGTATKTIETRKAKHGDSTMSREAHERAKSQDNNPNKNKKKK